MINIDNILSYPSLYPNEYNKGGNFIYIPSGRTEFKSPKLWVF